MKTFIFGIKTIDGECYKLRKCLTEAQVITSPAPLKDQVGCTIHLVGCYYRAVGWPEMERFLLYNRAAMGINIINREWDDD